MLDENIIEKLSERLVERTQALNSYILKKVGITIKQIGELTPSKAQELINVLKYGGSYQDILVELSKITNMNIEDIDKIFQEYSKKELQFAKQFYDYRGAKYLPFDENIALQRQTKALGKLTMGEFMNFSNANVLGYGLINRFGQVEYKGIKEVFNQLIDEAILSIAQGKESFDSAMYRQLKTMGNGGLRTIYPSGRTERLDSVVRRSLNQGLRTLHNANQELFGDEFDYNGLEVTHFTNSAPDHIDTIDGRQFALIDIIKKQIKSGTEKNIKSSDIQGNKVIVDGKTYYDFNAVNDDLDRHISTLNCRHTTFSIVVGVSKPEYTQEQLDKDKNKNEDGFEFDGKHYTLYEGEQLQRSLERQIRYEKDSQILGKESDNEQLIAKSQSRITQLTTKYNELCKASGLYRKAERMRVSGYKRTKS